jgi:N-acetylglucosamine-6-sulfatase
MNRDPIRLMFVLIGLLCTAALAQPVEPGGAPARGRGRGRGGPAPSATMPVNSGLGRGMHPQFLERARAGEIDLLFIGDSITDFWDDAPPNRGGKAVWEKYFVPLKAANFGINADRTQHVLWRMQNGELEGFKAKCIVLLIGTNNLSVPGNVRNTNEEALAGIRLIINEIRTRQPEAKLLLMGILPRGAAADDPYRANIKAVNAELAKMNDNQHMFFMDIGEKFLNEDGSLKTELMPDNLHPGEKGYEVWAEAIIGKVKELMGP